MEGVSPPPCNSKIQHLTRSFALSDKNTPRSDLNPMILATHRHDPNFAYHVNRLTARSCPAVFAAIPCRSQTSIVTEILLPIQQHAPPILFGACFYESAWPVELFFFFEPAHQDPASVGNEYPSVFLFRGWIESAHLGVGEFWDFRRTS